MKLDRGLLAFLERRKAEVPPPAELPSHLPLGSIIRHESLFQPRALDHGHVTALAGVLRSQGYLAPMLVIQIGPDAVLIDGHHRMSAYEAAQTPHPVPVTYFDGSVVEAVRQSGLANHQDKLRMDDAEKRNFAWRLVILERWSRAEEAAGSGVSPRTIARMRAVQTVLKGRGDDPFRFSTWVAAYMASRDVDGGGPELSDDELEDRLDEQAARYVDRMNKHFGRKLADPATAARVLIRYMGQGRVLGFIQQLMGQGHVSATDLAEAWAAASDANGDGVWDDLSPTELRTAWAAADVPSGGRDF